MTPEPVKISFATPGALTSAPPVSPAPCATRTSPSGAPASTNTRATHSPESGVSSDGFSTTAFPAATAIAVCVSGMLNGKFHGEMIPSTPSGSYAICARLCARYGMP